jgi:hypothetical protein
MWSSAAIATGRSVVAQAPATAEMIDLVEQAIQIGYAAALKDVENGDFDDDILQWRPDLADG